MVGNDQAGAGNYECPQDYLQLANVPLCGSRLNSQLNPPTPNPTTNAEVIGEYQSCIICQVGFESRMLNIPNVPFTR